MDGPALAAVLLAALCAGTMGFAIQRGATCTVAAVSEVVAEGRWTRLAALAEASLWVAGGLAAASTLGVLPAMPAAYAADARVVVGGVLLGFGAWVNRACVFGAIARLGSGDWAYAATPLGYYLGCLSADAVFGAPPPMPLSTPSPVLHAAGAFAIGFALFAAWRVATGLRRAAAERRAGAIAFAQRTWTPHAATAVIGITFVAILLAIGVWAYTDALAELAQGMTMRLALAGGLLLALIAGAIVGGRSAGRWASVPPSVAGVARCLAGGALMAWGSLLIPGSNDGLILVGMPLLRPYAWLAFATMCATIAAAMGLQRRIAAAGRPGA